MNDDTIIIRVSYAFDGELRGFSDLKFESQLAQRCFNDFRGVGISTNQRCFIAQFEKVHFVLRAHFFFPYSTSSERPVRVVVDSPRLFLILSIPRVTTPL